MEQVYQYLTGTKFRQRIEAVIEKFNDMREDLDRERRFMGKQWSKRGAQILAACLPRAYPSDVWVWLLVIKLLKTLALPRGIEPLFQP